MNKRNTAGKRLLWCCYSIANKHPESYYSPSLDLNNWDKFPKSERELMVKHMKEIERAIGKLVGVMIK